jgi:hypothetical protein
VKLELRAEVALEAVRAALAKRAARVTEGEVVGYYQGNRGLFDIPAERVVDLIELLPSAAAANALVRRLGTGRRFTQASHYHEVVLRVEGIGGESGKAKLVKAIFATEPGVASQPIKLFAAWPNSWVVFVVRKKIPPRPQPLAKVRAEIVHRLTLDRERAISASFDQEYRKRIARTNCSPGYHAPGCRQYAGALASYEDPFSR